MTGAASGTYNFVRQFGGALGAAALVVVNGLGGTGESVPWLSAGALGPSLLLCAAVMGYRRHMLVPGSESGSRVIGGVNPTHSSHIFPPCRPEKTGRADRIPLSPRIRAVGFQGRCSPRKKGQKTSFSLPLHKHTAVSTACPLELWGLPT